MVLPAHYTAQTLAADAAAAGFRADSPKREIRDKTVGLCPAQRVKKGSGCAFKPFLELSGIKGLIPLAF